MAAKARIKHLQAFLGTPSTAYKALQGEQKREYDEWHEYLREEKQARQRFGEVADSPDDVEVMIKGWRVEHPRPRVSEVVRGVLNEEAVVAAYGQGEGRKADVLGNALVFNEAPWREAECRICEGGVKGQPVYGLGCGHCLHVMCLEKEVDTWLGMKCQAKQSDDGGGECLRCVAFKELLRKMAREELEAQIQRMGERFLPWRRALR